MPIVACLPNPQGVQVTELLLAWGQGDDAALDRLIPAVHQELRRLARRQMRGERKDHTLQATALVNEAYVRLVDLARVQWRDRVHFFALSARMMRRILVDHARARNYQKRCGGNAKVTIDDVIALSPRLDTNLVALDDALDALASLDHRKSQVVELRYFGGLSVEETAEELRVSPATVMRDWRLAKAWLLREIAHHD